MAKSMVLSLLVTKCTGAKCFREVKMSDYDDDFMAEDEDYDLEYSEDSNRFHIQPYNNMNSKVSFITLTISVNLTWTWRTSTTTAKA